MVRVLLFAPLLFLGCSNLPKPDLPPFSDPRSSSLPLKLHAFNTGSVKVLKGAVARGESWLKSVRMDVPAFVAEHPAGLIVFDAGLPPEIAENPRKVMGLFNYLLVPFKMVPGQDLPGQMKASGLDPMKVEWVIVSHRHFDHLGSLKAFPNATVVLSKMEWEAAHGKVPGDWNSRRLSDYKFEDIPKLQLVDFSTAPAFGAFERGVDLLGDGSVILLEASGHTAGSMMAYLSLGPAGALLTGDASWMEMNYRIPAVQIYAYDKELHWKRLWQIKSWKERKPGLLVLPGHDLGPLRRSPPSEITLHP